MNKEINTKPLSGFMELKPAEQILFNKIKNTIEESYKLFGFIPMDNPLIERKEILFAKAGGETETQIYQFKKGKEDLSLRFDLTVPLARYVSNKYGELTFPFKRYQIGKVYRGERPQAGRFREFYQADIDVIGDGELSLNFDAEVIAVAVKIFKDLGLQAKVKINNRKIFDGIFEELNIKSEKEKKQILINIDKINKQNLGQIISINQKIADFEPFLSIQGDSNDILNVLKNTLENNKIFQEGVLEIKGVIKNLRALGVQDDDFKIDLSIARGLDYYTGTVYETQLVDYPEIGSVCSGGRYENLASEYIDKKLPGVGISIGLSRLFDQLLKKEIIKSNEATYTKILILPMTENEKNFALDLVSKIRAEKIPAEIDLRFEKKMAKRAKYAEKLKIPFVLFLGENEAKNKIFDLKNFNTGEKFENLNFEILIKKIK